MTASNGPNFQVWQYDAFHANWAPVTGTNTTVYSIAAAGDVLCMLAANNIDHVARVWQYGLSAVNWTPLTGTNTQPNQLLVQDGNELYIAARAMRLQPQLPGAIFPKIVLAS